MGKLVNGIGINDADYLVIIWEPLPDLPDGKRRRALKWICPYYRAWRGMISRCYQKIDGKIKSAYEGCTVSEEWLTFSNFKSWMEKKDWEGKSLDKDLLFPGNSVYSPENCVFIHRKINSFIAGCTPRKRTGKTGCKKTWNSSNFTARCSNPFTGKQEFIGSFETIDLAHNAWVKRKHELALLLADSEYVTDERVRIALRNYFIDQREGTQ